MTYEQRIQQMVDMACALDPTPERFRAVAQSVAEEAFRLGLEARLEQVKGVVEWMQDPRVRF